jgi:acetolactate synthase-1/2/3 large subunit
MKVSRVVAEILSEYGVDQVFGVSGGASLHILKAINDHTHLNLTCLHHEQCVAMAAEAYSRLSNKLGVGVVTSGPGATNLITGIAGAYYDSVPVLYLTGQVSTTRMKGERKVRQIGFQETPIVEMVKEITKYAVTVDKPENLEGELRKAIRIALTGRKGPVLVDIPDDVQRLDIDYNSKLIREFLGFEDQNLDPENLQELREILLSSSKPIIVCGAGIQLTSKRSRLIEKLHTLNVPTALTWGAKDLISSPAIFLLGTFGTHGERYVNLMLNEADLILSIGSRLDLKATGTPQSTFAPNAKKIMIDVDMAEVSKFDDSGLQISHSIQLNFESDGFDQLLQFLEFDEVKVASWKEDLLILRNTFPAESRVFSGSGVNPYTFIEALSDSLTEPSNLLIDTGCAIAWTMQVWKSKANQRIFHDFNNTAMGWSIPATIASLLSNPEKNHICLIGDGSIMMALSDLSTLSSLNGASKIIILNNSGYGMIKQTQDQWFEGDYFASDSGVDLIFPSFEKIAEATGFRYLKVTTDEEISDTLITCLNEQSPTILEVVVQSSARVIPIVKFGNPNHIMEPTVVDSFR